MREPERRKIETLLECFTIIPLDAALAESGGLLRRDFGKSHDTSLADAIIAATVQPGRWADGFIVCPRGIWHNRWAGK